MKPAPAWLAVVLWIALLAGILVGWSPLYWPFAVSIVALSAVACIWSFAGSELVLVPEALAVAAIAAWGFLQLAMGRSEVPSMTLRAALTWTGCAVAFLLGSNILNDRRARHLFLRIMMWTLALLAIEALLQFFLAPQAVFGIFEAPESVTGTLFYRNQFAALMELGGAVALWQVLKGRPVIGALCFAAMFGSVVATASRAGAVLMIVELSVFVFLAFRGNSRPAGSKAVGLLIVTFAVAAAAVVGTDTLWERFQDRDFFATRRELRESTMRMIPAAPLLGTGMGTWRAAYPRYATLDAALVANEAHNDWLQWISDGGIPFGLFILAVAIGAAAGAGADAWGLGLIAVMVHCLVDYPMRAPAISFLWFTMAGAACSLRQMRRETVRQDTSESLKHSAAPGHSL